MSDIVERLRKAVNDRRTVSTTVQNGVRHLEIGCDKELLLDAVRVIEELERAWSAILERNIQLNRKVDELQDEIKRISCLRCPDKGKCTGCNIYEK